MSWKQKNLPLRLRNYWREIFTGKSSTADVWALLTAEELEEIPEQESCLRKAFERSLEESSENSRDWNS